MPPEAGNGAENAGLPLACLLWHLPAGPLVALVEALLLERRVLMVAQVSLEVFRLSSKGSGHFHLRPAEGELCIKSQGQRGFSSVDAVLVACSDVACLPWDAKERDTVSAAVHAAGALLYPLRWQHIYLPLLPLALKVCTGLPELRMPRTSGSGRPIQQLRQPASAQVQGIHRGQGFCSMAPGVLAVICLMCDLQHACSPQCWGLPAAGCGPGAQVGSGSEEAGGGGQDA